VGKIKRLPSHVANQIAAGEVVERPASVVKELVENSLDAGASAIEIRLHDGGRRLIEVKDDGEGLSRKDLELAVMPHATSKIFYESDLACITTLGFRGEALSSISAVSDLRILSRPREDDQGWQLSVSFGRDLKIVPAGCPQGTIIKVQDLFLKVPARYKFLKSRQTELSRCLKVVRAFAVCWPEVVFTVRNEKRQIFRTNPDASEMGRLEPLFGQEIIAQMVEVSGGSEGMKLKGFMASPDEVRLSSRHMYFFMNRRLISSPVLWKAVNEALRGMMVKGNYPAGVLFLEVEPRLVDVNVHPSKSEVRFQEPETVYRLVYHAIRRALGQRIASLDEEEVASVQDEVSGHVKEGDRAYRSTFSQQALVKGSGSIPLDGKNPLPWEEDARKKGGLVEGVSTKGPFPSPGSLPSSIVDDHDLKETDSIRVIGQFAGSFILSELEDKLLIFDQHAAHEALLFKRLLHEFESRGSMERQPLMFPHLLEVDESMMEGLENASVTLFELGIEVDAFGLRQVAIRTVPSFLSPSKETIKVVEEIVTGLLSNPNRSGREALRQWLAKMACSMAIKANSCLHREQMKSLIQDCIKEGVRNCPHGRPIMREISIKELERDFYRQ